MNKLFIERIAVMNELLPHSKAYSYIRFSTPEQVKGDSLRRQLKLSEDFAAEHNLELDKDLHFRDLGISAFKGDNRSRGALKKFLDLIEENKISKGSVLLIESLDRLSREQVLDAFNLFSEIIKQGITIVTLSDSKIYTKDSVNANFSDLMFSLLVMSRAHEESLSKSRRISAAWANKRKLIKEKKLTGRCPAWLKLNKDKSEFTQIPERCDVIKIIFDLYLSGKGMFAIEHDLNVNPTLRWKPKNGWRKSYIQKILRNSAVIGDFQPYVMDQGKRNPTGEIIKGYFPQIIDKDVFYSVQENLKKNRFFGGRNGKVNNLFGGIAKCGYCGAPMQFINKGKKGSKFLICDNARRGIECFRIYANYDDIEKAVLTYTRGLKINEILNKENYKHEILELKANLFNVHEKMENLTKEIQNITNAMASTSDKKVQDHWNNELSRLFKEETMAQELEKELKSKINKIKNKEQNIKAHVESIDYLYTILKEINEEDNSDIRFKLRDKLRGLISKITIFPGGKTRCNKDNVESFMNFFLKDKPEIKKDTEKLRIWKERLITPKGDKNRCEITIYFDDGNYRVLTPYREPFVITETDIEKNIYVSYGENLAGKGEFFVDVLDEDKEPTIKPKKSFRKPKMEK